LKEGTLRGGEGKENTNPMRRLLFRCRKTSISRSLGKLCNERGRGNIAGMEKKKKTSVKMTKKKGRFPIFVFKKKRAKPEKATNREKKKKS